jgi:hypothetical protein
VRSVVPTLWIPKRLQIKSVQYKSCSEFQNLQLYYIQYNFKFKAFLYFIRINIYVRSILGHRNVFTSKSFEYKNCSKFQNLKICYTTNFKINDLLLIAHCQRRPAVEVDDGRRRFAHLNGRCSRRPSPASARSCLCADRDAPPR